MPKKYDRPLTTDELLALPDSDIDFSDIPETTDEEWKHAVVQRAGTWPTGGGTAGGIKRPRDLDGEGGRASARPA